MTFVAWWLTARCGVLTSADVHLPVMRCLELYTTRLPLDCVRSTAFDGMAVEQASSRNTVTAAEADTTDYYYKMCVTARLHENERPLSCQLYRHVSVIVYVDDVTVAVIRHAACNLLLSVSRLTLQTRCAFARDISSESVQPSPRPRSVVLRRGARAKHRTIAAF